MQVKSITGILRYSIMLVVMITYGYSQDYTPKIFSETNTPTFSNTRTFANSDSLTHKEGFAKGYTIYVQTYLIADEILLDPVYKVDMDNDGVWETSSWHSGYNHVTYDYPAVEPGQTGSETIRIRIRHIENNQFVFNDYYFDIVTLHSPENAYQTPDGDLMVGFTSSDGVIDKPLVIVEGFDVFNATWPSYYYNRMQDMILTYLSPAGYDVFFVNFADGSTELQNNAMTVLGALNNIADNNYIFSTKLLGISMGGVISRYALAFAEDSANNINHGCNMFISYDAPQQGAHISTSLQNFICGIDTDVINNLAIELIQSQLQTIAAKQLLSFNYYDQDQGPGGNRDEIDGGPMYEAFYNELNALNGDGYPNQTYNIGISNGHGDIANRTMESSWPESYEDNSLMTLTFLGLPVETISFSRTDIVPGSHLPAFRDQINISGDYIINPEVSFLRIPVDIEPTILDFGIMSGNAPCYIWAQSALDLINVEYSTNPAQNADITNWEYSPFDQIFAQNDDSYYHDQMTGQAIAYILSLLLYPQVDVTFKNTDESGALLDGYLSVTGYNQEIPSGDQQPVPGYTPLIVKTNQRYLDSGSLKHNHWNSNNDEFRVEHIKEFFPGDVDEARFHLLYDIAIMDNVSEYPIEVQLHDPWYYDESTQTQPDAFSPLSDQDDGSGNVQVFLDQNENFSEDYPIYSLKAPRLYATTDGIYEFHEWTGSGVDFGNGANNPTTSAATDVVFLNSGATIEAVYSETPINSIPGSIILVTENLTIPAGADYGFAGNTKISVWGATLNIEGTPQNPVMFSSTSSLHPFYGIECIVGGRLNISNCVIDGATTGIHLTHNLSFLNANNVTYANLETGVRWDGDFIEEEITIKNSAFYNCNTPIILTAPGSVLPPDDEDPGGGGSTPSYTIQYNLFDTFPGDITLDETNDVVSNLGMVDPTNGDFSLQWNSPCIDAGDPNDLSDPDGTVVDIGAFVYQLDSPVLSIAGEVGDNPRLNWNTVPQQYSTKIWRYFMSIDEDGQLADENIPGTEWVDTRYIISAIVDDRREVIRQESNENQTESVRLNYRIKAVDQVDHLSPYSNEDYIYVEMGGSPLKEMVVDNEQLPEKYTLYNAYPNPFNPTTNIRFDLPERSQVTLIIYDLMGREIKRLIYSEMNAGFVKAMWNGTDKYGQQVASGVYLYTFTAKSLESDKTFTDKRKMVLMK